MNKKTVYRSLCSIILLFGFIPIASADYKPPQNQVPPKHSSKQLGTKGGCENLEQTDLKLLAPQEYVGQTISTHPTFAWQINDSHSFSLEFSLYKYGSNDKPILIYKYETQSKPEIMTVTLPQNLPPLVKGERYLWQVAVLCNPAFPSEDIMQVAEFEVKELPSNFSQQLSQSDNHLKRSQLLAENGFWYDALSEALQTGDKNRIEQLLIKLN